ncbi:unnamed protein product [Paramecium sonneborni]|uniref:Dynein heavy chain hydrolytic ATP-binding dynein motor region domain-containing protein n=1 Tax=Paramecium sonneborni TaxID=65129 RepID=A0A8S1MYJ7_9CILI|nr:unnamed protein product [Paramecium sonneborni]
MLDDYYRCFRHQIRSSTIRQLVLEKQNHVKILAKTLGRYCIVFNCSKQITLNMMEKLFAGQHIVEMNLIYFY